jgi:uncharacterized protein
MSGGCVKMVLRPFSAAILGGSIIVAAAIGGSFAVKTVKASKTLNRVVTVRGLSEREVKADLAIWPLGFKVAANDLPSLQREIARCRESIERFLLAQGFEKSEIGNVPPKIQDFEANGYVNEKEKGVFRYAAESSVVLRSAQTDKVVAAMERADTLISDGVPLCQDYDSHAKFLFTGLSSIKPSMIEEANKDARAAAGKFAKDSGCSAGRIMRATQGSFEIDERDRQTPLRKTVRVVTTVDFLLE